MDKNKLLEAAIIRTKEVQIEGQTVRIREVGTSEFSEYGETAKNDKVKATAGLISTCVVGEDNKPVFTAEEAYALAKIVRMAVPIVNAIMEVSGIVKSEETEAEKHVNAS